MEVSALSKNQSRLEITPLKIMEVCGTHTSAIYKSGLKSLLPESIKLVSGPGCPVCVTEEAVIKTAADYSINENSVVLSFGDMFRLLDLEPITNKKNVKMVYSPLEAVKLAKACPDREIIFVAVGFETTIPVYCVLLEELIAQNIENVKLLTSLKTMPRALDYICKNEEIDGFLCPGHVSAIIGSAAFQPLCERYKKPFVIAGFEPANILAGINEIAQQLTRGEHKVVNFYKSVVSEQGQLKALSLINKYFEETNVNWRGIGVIENSGLKLREEYSRFNAEVLDISITSFDNKSACKCAEVLLGKINPDQCPLFKTSCSPENPIGACMVSSEGACRIYAD